MLTRDSKGAEGTGLQGLESQLDDQMNSVGDSAKCKESFQDKFDSLQKQLDDHIRRTGTQHERTKVPMPSSCADVKTYDPVNGVHTLNIYGRNVTVFCDQVADGGGWAVIQRRRDGSVSFDQGWAAYDAGFGDLNGEFWLGLEKMHWLTASRKQTLRVELSDFEGKSAFAKYDEFVIGGPDSYYRLHVEGYSGNAGNSMNYSNNSRFTTKDADHDSHSIQCAVHHSGAWWHNSCTHSNLNAVYTTIKQNGNAFVHWNSWKSDEALKYAEMKIRPQELSQPSVAGKCALTP